jgi:hypothetical protein
LHGIDGFDAFFFRFVCGVGWMRRGVCGGLGIVVLVVVVVRAGGLLIDSRKKRMSNVSCVDVDDGAPRNAISRQA